MGEKSCLTTGLDNFFSPGAIAVIGASSDPNKLGYKLVDNIRKGGFKGKIFPVNIKGNEVAGISSVKDLDEVRESIDLAMICLPSDLVRKALVSVGKRSIPYAIIVSAGFGESGNIEGIHSRLDYHQAAPSGR